MIYSSTAENWGQEHLLQKFPSVKNPSVTLLNTKIIQATCSLSQGKQKHNASTDRGD